MLEYTDHWEPNSAQRYLAPLQEYKETVRRLFPALEGRVLDNCSIFTADALFLGYFLEHYPRKVFALEIGAFVGASTFCLASHPAVSKVVSVDPNPIVAEELTANSDTWVGRIDLRPLKDIRVLDIARSALEEYPTQHEKIEFREGVVGSTQIGARLDPDESMSKVEVPAPLTSEEEALVALVDGLHTREGARKDLEAIFERNPGAIALLDDCHHAWGPFVQAGVVDFMEQSQEEYRFQLVGDLGPALRSSNFGILYPTASQKEVDGTLGEVGRTFSRHLDPLQLLNRETELIGAINNVNRKLELSQKEKTQLNQQNHKMARELELSQKEKTQLNQQNNKMARELQHARPQLNQLSKTKEENSKLRKSRDNLQEQLANEKNRRTYKAANGFANLILRVPGTKNFLRKP